MTVGFTGTRQGMTEAQLNKVAKLFLTVAKLHLGDCIGADAQAHAEALRQGIKTIGHPPLDSDHRAFLAYAEERRAKTYLARNAGIVAEGFDGLIAAPRDFTQPTSLRGHATWMIIAYARKTGRRIWTVLPDGMVMTG